MLCGMKISVSALGLFISSALASTMPPSVTVKELNHRPGVTYAFTIISPREYRLAVKAFDHPVQVADIPGKIQCSGVSIAGGFSRKTDDGYSPEGLVKTSSAQLSDIAPWPDGGIFSIQGNRGHIVRVALWRTAPPVTEMALQARPILVFDGKVDEPLRSPQRWNRIAVGTLNDDSIVFVGAFTPRNNAVTLREFAQDAKLIFGGKLTALLNMDGGPSAFMHSNSVSLLPTPGAVTTYICAEAQ